MPVPFAEISWRFTPEQLFLNSSARAAALSANWISACSFIELGHP
jgi:hypothetical protein